MMYLLKDILDRQTREIVKTDIDRHLDIGEKQDRQINKLLKWPNIKDRKGEKT